VIEIEIENPPDDDEESVDYGKYQEGDESNMDFGQVHFPSSADPYAFS